MGPRAPRKILLFMVHGNGVDHRILTPLEETLTGSEQFEVHNIDLPGFGNRPALANAAGLPELANWLETTIQRIAADRKFALLGNSMGGLLCQEVADRFAKQLAGLFLLAPAVFPESERREIPDKQVLVQNPGFLSTLDPREAQLFADMAVVQTKENWESFSRWVLPGLDCADLRAMARLSKRYFLEELPVHRDARLEVPVTIVCGKQDHVTGYRDPELLLRRYPYAKLVVLDPAGHNVHLEQPNAVNRELSSWSAQVASHLASTKL